MIVTFPPQAPAPKNRRYAAVLTRDRDTIHCAIFPGGHDHWQCVVRLNKAETLAQFTDHAAHLDRIARFMDYLVAGLKADGWTER